MGYEVIKGNKNLYIVDDNGQRVYGIPFWLKSQLHSRDEFRELAATFSAKECCDIEAIIAFEAKLRRRLQGEE
jgi:hypothetical protein